MIKYLIFGAMPEGIDLSDESTYLKNEIIGEIKTKLSGNSDNSKDIPKFKITDIYKIPFDYIIVSGDYETSFPALIKAKVPYEKIVPISLIQGIFYVNSNLRNYYNKIVATFTLSYFHRERILKFDEDIYDYFRYSTLDLILEQIFSKKLTGSIAELGVFRGVFASKLNYALPDKKLYLFDTFGGFPQQDMEYDMKNNQDIDYDGMFETFKNTNIDIVLDRMYNKESCIIKQGYFPETAVDVDDTFCFVSIDTDLYVPTLAGLDFFYPRLISQGYIMIHDYHNEGAPGVKQAVDEWCLKNKVAVIPIPDQWGSAIITKNS